MPLGRVVADSNNFTPEAAFYIASPHGKIGEGRSSRLHAPNSDGNTSPRTAEFPPAVTGHKGCSCNRGLPIATDGGSTHSAAVALEPCLPATLIPLAVLKLNARYDSVVPTAGGTPLPTKQDASYFR